MQKAKMFQRKKRANIQKTGMRKKNTRNIVNKLLDFVLCARKKRFFLASSSKKREKNIKKQN